MVAITKSRLAMMLVAVAAFAFAVGDAFGVGAYASATPGHAGRSLDLIHAANWLQLVAGVVALVGVCAAGWDGVLRQAWTDVGELGAAAVATLLVAVGLLITAASTDTDAAGNVVAAVGIGGWALLALSMAARRSLFEHAARERATAAPPQAVVWLAAASGLLLVAIGSGLTVQVQSKSVGITAGAFHAVGTALLVGVLVVSGRERFVASRSVPAVVGGLAVLSIASVADAVVAGIAFGPDGTLLGLRIGLSIALSIELVGIALLGWAARERVGELAARRLPWRTAPSRPGAEAPPWTSEAVAQPPGPHPDSRVARPCPSCGAPVLEGVQLCSRCGERA